MIVDNRMVSTGSTSFDNRSFRLNDEANLNIYDAAFATEQTAVFENDLKRSKKMDLATWNDRPLSERMKEKLASLQRSQV